MKKLLSIVLFLLLISTVAHCEESAESTIIAEGDIGKHHVVVVDAELTEDYEGNTCIAFTFDWSHTDEEAQSFMFALSYIAYQDGIQLDGTIIDGDVSDNLMRNIKGGATLQVQYGFVLRNTESDVELELAEFISMNNDKIEVTVPIP